MVVVARACDVKALDLDAKFYRDHSSLQLNLSEKVLKECVFRPSSSVLDVGCGDGRVTANILSKIASGRVVGIDASENMISLARQTFPQSQFPGLEFQVSRAEDFCSAPEKFDSIVSFSCLHWVRTPITTIQNLCKMLNSNGDITVLTYPKESMFYQFLDEASKNYPEFREKSAYNTMLSIQEYNRALQGHVSISQFQVYNLTASFKGTVELKNFIKGWLTSFIPLPEILHDEYLESALKISHSYAIDLNNGMINLPYTALVIRAHKT